MTDPPLAPSKHTTLIGLNVNGLMYFDSEKNVYSLGLALQYPKFLTRLIQMLLDVDSTRILIVPHTFGGEECDPSASVHLLSKMPKELRSRIHLITQEYDQHELKGIIGRCDFFIGSRMHSCIAALSQGIPTIGVAYSRKFSGVFETVGADQWVIDGKTQREDLALAAIARMLAQRRASADSLRQNIPTVIASLARTFNEMFGRATAQAAKSGG